MNRWGILCFVLTLSPISSVSGNDWVGGAGDNLWNNADNWLQRTTMWVDGEELPGPDAYIVPPDAYIKKFFQLKRIILFRVKYFCE